MSDLEKIREFLRRNNQFEVRINLWDLYGCYRIELFRSGQFLWSDLGAVLEHRYQNLLKELEEKGYKNV